STDGTEREILPRALALEILLRDVHSVCGVAGGFVVVGVMKGALVTVPYDWPGRYARIQNVGEHLSRRWECDYDPAHQTVIVWTFENSRLQKQAVDLTVPSEMTFRAQDALRKTNASDWPPGKLRRLETTPEFDLPWRRICLNSATGFVRLSGSDLPTTE